MFTFTTANFDDIDGVLQLQERNLLRNIPLEKQSSGFVTTPFSQKQLNSVIQENGLFVVKQGENIVGYAFAASWDYFSQWAIFPYMVSRFPNLTYDNQVLTKEKTFQYGPICIDEMLRGTGLFQQLFETMRLGMSAAYPIGVTFINKINHRSFKAHTQKLKMTVIDEFSFNGNNYFGLAFNTNKSIL